MNVVHVSASITSAAGGIGPVIWNVVSRSKEHDIQSSVVTYNEESSTYSLYQDLELYKCKLLGPLKVGFSPDMSTTLKDLASCDVIHSHGLWLRNGYYARKEADRREVPLVVSPHGMLEPYALARSKFKKRLVSLLYEKSNLRRADCLQAASMQEAINIKKAGLKNDIAVIPFGVDMPNSISSDIGYLNAKYPGLSGKKIMLFLSRIHPKKGLNYLIEAWDLLHKKYPEWRLVIAGPDEGGYKAEIERLISDKDLDDFVTFVGPVHGNEKNDWYTRASIFVLPTLSENYGFVVPEALSLGCPVITTKGTPWSDLQEFGCGWWTEIGVEPLIGALEESLGMNQAELEMMGERGKKMVESKYSWLNSLNKFKDLYLWLTANSSKPEFII